MRLVDIETLCRMLNEQALAYAAMLLPNGVRDGQHWKTSSIDDVPTARHSLVVNLGGMHVGQWRDFGGCRPGEDKGDILDLIRLRKCGGDKRAAIEWAKADLGISDDDRAGFERRREAVTRAASERAKRHEEDRARFRRNAQRIWLSGVNLAHADGFPARDYLANRGIDLQALGKAPGALHYRPDVMNREAGRPLPGMVASINALDGSFLAVHRTWLAKGQQGWRKADLAEPKMTLANALGGHIPLWKGLHPGPLHSIPGGTPVYVSEGIEDGLSIAMAMREARVIACVSLSKLGALELPDQVGPLVVIGQRDPVGSKAVDALENGIGQQQAKGREVQIIYPPEPYKDFNEWLQKAPAEALGLAEERKAG